jgi:hypothetical protein
VYLKKSALLSKDFIHLQDYGTCTRSYYLGYSSIIRMHLGQEGELKVAAVQMSKK